MTLFNGQQGQRCKGKAERPLLRSCDFCYTIVGELASILNHRKCNDECPLSAIPSIQTISLPLSHFTIFSFPASFLMTSSLALSLSFSPIRTHFISTQLFRLKIPAKKLFWKWWNVDVTLIGRNGHQIFAFWDNKVFFLRPSEGL